MKAAYYILLSPIAIVIFVSVMVRFVFLAIPLMLATMNEDEKAKRVLVAMLFWPSRPR